MGRRGKISVSSDLSLECEGETLPDANPLWTLLTKSDDWPEDLDSANVHFPLTEEALKSLGLRLCCARQAQTYRIWTEPEVSDLVFNREPSRPLRQGT